MVTDFKVGDRIFSEPVYRPCYRCEACRQKDYWRCSHGGENEIGKAINGAFAEYLAIPFVTKMNALKAPDTMSYHDLALIDHLSLAASLARRAEHEKLVVVLGQDITGLGAVALLKKRGVPKVIASDISKIRQKGFRRSRRRYGDRFCQSGCRPGSYEGDRWYRRRLRDNL